jgi:hypothetical protein
MFQQKSANSRKLRQELLLISVLFINVLTPVHLKAAEASREDIRKTLLIIKQKYQALSERQAQAEIQTKPNTSLPQVQIIDPDRVNHSVNTIESEMPRQINALQKTVEYEGRFAVGEELILSMNLGSIPLGDILAINSVKGVKIGLSEFFQLVDFAIDVDIDNSRAEGWFIVDKNLFSLSASTEKTLQVKVNNRQFSVPASRFFVDDDIYVELADIADWFSVTTNFNEERLAINIITSLPFPIEKIMQRRLKRFDNSQGYSESVLPLKDSGYQLFSVPLLDLQLSTQFTSSENTSSYSILSSQDAAYFSSQLFLRGNDNNSLNDARLTLTRKASEADLLGPLGMTEYAFGDVTPVNIGMGNTQGLGRGFSMSNAANQLVDNRLINLVGEVQIGWDVELYRNGILLDNRTNVVEGRYEFNDVELSYGQNNFELVFYGAQGQIERRTESHFVDRNALESSQGIMQFSLVDNNRSLLGVGDNEDDPSLNGQSLSTTYDYGITDWFSIGVGASLFSPKLGENVQGLSFKSNLALGSYGLLNSIFQFDDDIRRSMLHSFRTEIENIGLDMSYRRDEFLADDLLQAESVLRSASENFSVRMSGTLFEGSDLPISYENMWNRSRPVNGNISDQFQNSIGVNTRWGSLSNGIVWQRNRVSNDNLQAADEAGGSLAYRTRIGRVFTRIFSAYQIKPVSELTSIGTTLNYAFNNQVNSELRYTYNVLDKKDSYDLRVNWSGDTFTFSSIANYDNDGDWNINLNVRFGLGYETETDTFFSSSRSLANSGAIVVRMFEDENLDQQYTEGETVLENVGIRAVQSFRQENTSQDGIVVLKSLSTERATDIVVDENSFSDPTMTVSSEGFAVAARRGLIQQFDIPVVKGGELDGVIYLRGEDDVEQVAPYVRLSLVNEQGDVISSTRSEYDGYYLFEKILPGSYQIRVDTSTGRQRGTTPERLKQVNISNRGDLIIDVDLVLRQLKSADGYIATVGEFSSLGLLKVYFKLLSERVDSTLLSQAFYIESKQTRRYLLGAKYIEGQSEEAKQNLVTFCQELQDLDVDCKAGNVGFEY